MPNYLLSTYAVEGAAREPMSDEEMGAFMGRIGELEGEMKTAGALVHSGRLTGIEEAAVVQAEGGEPIVTDGPFVEIKKHIGGFYIVAAADRNEALDWAAKT